MKPTWNWSQKEQLQRQNKVKQNQNQKEYQKQQQQSDWQPRWLLIALVYFCHFLSHSLSSCCLFFLCWLLLLAPSSPTCQAAPGNSANFLQSGSEIACARGQQVDVSHLMRPMGQAGNSQDASKSHKATPSNCVPSRLGGCFCCECPHGVIKCNYSADCPASIAGLDQQHHQPQAQSSPFRPPSIKPLSHLAGWTAPKRKPHPMNGKITKTKSKHPTTSEPGTIKFGSTTFHLPNERRLPLQVSLQETEDTLGRDFIQRRSHFLRVIAERTSTTTPTPQTTTTTTAASTTSSTSIYTESELDGYTSTGSGRELEPDVGILNSEMEPETEAETVDPETSESETDSDVDNASLQPAAVTTTSSPIPTTTTDRPAIVGNSIDIDATLAATKPNLTGTSTTISTLSRQLQNQDQNHHHYHKQQHQTDQNLSNEDISNDAVFYLALGTELFVIVLIFTLAAFFRYRDLRIARSLKHQQQPPSTQASHRPELAAAAAAVVVAPPPQPPVAPSSSHIIYLSNQQQQQLLQQAKCGGQTTTCQLLVGCHEHKR